MISRLLAETKPTPKPRRPGRPRSPEAAVVRECAAGVGRNAIPATKIAKRLGVHRSTVYRWLRAENAA